MVYQEDGSMVLGEGIEASVKKRIIVLDFIPADRQV